MRVFFVSERPERRRGFIRILHEYLRMEGCEEIHIRYAGFDEFEINLHTRQFDLAVIDLNLERGAAHLIWGAKHAPCKPSHVLCIYGNQSVIVADGAIDAGATGCLHVPEDALEDPEIVFPFLREHLAAESATR